MQTLVLSLEFGKGIKPRRRVLDCVRQACGNFMTLDRIKPEIFASIAIKQDLLPRDDILMVVYHLSDVAITAVKSGGKTIFAGNGGSFDDAQHLSAEFTSGSSLTGHHWRRLRREPTPLPCVRLAMMRFSRARAAS